VCVCAFADVSACVTMCLDGCQCWIFSFAVPARLPYPLYYYFALIGKRSIVMMTVSVSLSLCVFVCPRAYLWKYTSYLHLIFVHVWPWLGPPPAALRYVMYFQFYG